MSVTISPAPWLFYMNNNNAGGPAVGFKLFTYIAGTSTKQATWSDSTQTVTNANPIILDANGFVAAASGVGMWLDPTLTYKFVLALAIDTDPPLSPIRTEDNVQGPITGSTLSVFVTQSFLGPIINPQTAAETAAGVTPSNYIYAPGNVLRYGTNTTPGTTDMTAAIQAAINQASRGGAKVRVPQGTYAITQDLIGYTGTLPLQGGTGPFALDIEGEGREQTLIQAISGGAGFTHAMLYINATPYQLAGSVTGIRFDGGSLTTDCVVFTGCDILISRDAG